MGDWTYDLISKPDVAMIKRPDIESSFDNTQKPILVVTSRGQNLNKRLMIITKSART